MHPTVSEQLAGIRQVLADVVAPTVTDPYPADVLTGALAVLDLLADTWTEVPRFLRWDSEQTAVVLAMVGDSVPPAPADQLDIAALEAHHRHVRAQLERAIPAILGDEPARTAMVRLFRDRAERFPTNRPSGGSAAHAAR